ncbi:nardilysin-like [Cimex lectularius]|uniref:Nardilysin n=1 Tax=Cimex lectularius TaxID=79782 RepID=A0A8I6RM94_CIMLE|nr:nardilysin-like [Cimex lectularius]
MLRGSVNCFRLLVGARNMSKRFKSDMPPGARSGSPTENIINEDTYYENFTELPAPIKSPSDKKIYSALKLQNGLVCTIVSDVTNLVELEELDSDIDETSSSDYYSDSVSVTSDQSLDLDSRQSKIPPKEEKLAACSLTVNVGSFSDPEAIQGLAHFVEHMVFMGSSKYPKENEFDSFITKNGGSDNATTECEYTTFYFECQERHLEKALDIFSQFFKAPLMKKEAMTRERQAIESEFQMALPSDTYRKQQLLCSMVHENNPAHKFTWGNELTLKANITDDFLYKSAHNFRKEHYSAHRMKLAIQARLPEELLRKWVINYFSGIKNNGSPKVVFKVPNPTGENFNKLYYVESVNDTFRLDMSWMLPPVIDHYRSKPLSYLSSIIGHEGKGSLLSYLKKKLWVMSLTAGNSDEGLSSNSIYSIFSISMFLTDLGRSHLDEVLLAVFSYLKMLRMNCPNEYLFNELKTIADVDFKYQEESDAVTNVENLSENMLYYNSEEFITGPELYFEYNPELIVKFLNMMQHYNVNIMVSAKATANHMTLNRVEPWFNTRYYTSDIPQQWIKDWKDIHIMDDFHLPEVNNFITNDFSLIESSKVSRYPEKCKSNDQITIWYKGDDKFLLPVGFVGIHILKNNLHKNSLTTVMASVYVRALKELLMERLYPACAALYEFSFEVNEYGISINAYGYNQNLHLLLDEIAQGIFNIGSNISIGFFNAIQEVLLRNFYNENLNTSSVARELRMSILVKEYYSHLDKFRALKVLDYDTFLNFIADFFKNVRFQCLVQGNLTKDEAIACCENFVSKLKSTPLSDDNLPHFTVLELPIGEKCVRVNSFNLEDKNCVTTNYYQFCPGYIKDCVALELILMMMEEPLFDKLRTQEQLGYDVSCSVKEIYGIIGFTISVHSQIDKFTVDHIQSRMADFLHKFQDFIKKMPDEEFKDAANTLIKVKKCVDTHLKEEARRNWIEIKNMEYVFDRIEKEIKCICALKKKHLNQLLGKYLSPDKNYKKLTIQVVGHKTARCETKKDYNPSNIPEELMYEFVHYATDQQYHHFITDLYEFKNNLNSYPHHKLIS